MRILADESCAGLGAYGEGKDEERADMLAMARIRACTAAGGLLVLTTPFGTAARSDGFTRVYDHSQLLITMAHAVGATSVNHIGNLGMKDGDIPALLP